MCDDLSDLFWKQFSYSLSETLLQSHNFYFFVQIYSECFYKHINPYFPRWRLVEF